MESDTSAVTALAGALFVFGAAAIYLAVLVINDDSGVGDGVDQVFAWVPLGLGGLATALLAAIAVGRRRRRPLIAAAAVALALVVYGAALTWLAAE